jgi:hypothetical protein
VLRVELLRILFLVIYINEVSRIVWYPRFHIYGNDLQVYHTSAVSDIQMCIDELNLNLQRVHESD